MVNKNKPLQFFITTTLLFLGVIGYYWNENKKLTTFQEEIPASIARMLHVVSNQTCIETTTYICSTQLDCSKMDILAMQRFCNER